VVIPTFNAEATLLRAVRSALDQTMREIEVIIVDDASSDSTWDLVTDIFLQDRRVRVLRHKQNTGKPIAMNRAIAIARGHWLAVLDADDWYHPDRLKALIGVANRWQADMVADNQFFYDAPANSVVGTAWPARSAAWELTFDDFLAGSNAYETFNLGMLKPIVRLDFMREVGLAYEEKARHGQDFFHLLQFFLANGRAVIGDTPYYYYTQPFGVISRRWSHQARKRYDFQNAYDINQRYLLEAEKTLPLRQLNLLKARNRRLRLLEYYYQTKDAFVRRDRLKALGLLTRHPAILGYLFRRLRGRLLRHPPYFMTIHRISLRSCRRIPPGGLDAGQPES
jgi:succinoglycan biosynthesis protein ExoO